MKSPALKSGQNFDLSFKSIMNSDTMNLHLKNLNLWVLKHSLTGLKSYRHQWHFNLSKHWLRATEMDWTNFFIAKS